MPTAVYSNAFSGDEIGFNQEHHCFCDFLRAAPSAGVFFGRQGLAGQVTPGAIALTRTSGASSIAKLSVSPTTAAFDA
jgi:hypothetical protein